MLTKESYRISNCPVCGNDEYCKEICCSNCHKTNYLHIKKGVSVETVFSDRPVCQYCGCGVASDKTWNLPKETNK